MHSIVHAAINRFGAIHPDAQVSLNAWAQLASKNKFSTFNGLKAIFLNMDAVKNKNGDSLTVFNIHGNAVRLVAAIHYKRKYFLC